MKLLQINAVYGFGSTGMIVQEIDFMAKEMGIESYVAYAGKKQSLQNGYYIGNYFDHKLHAALSRIAGKQGYYSVNATKRFLKYIDTLQLDILHLHNLHANYINLNMLLDYVAKRNIKTVITQHDCWYFTGKCFHYTSIGCTKWMDHCGDCPKKYQDTPALLYDSTQQIINDRRRYLLSIPNLTIVCVSDWLNAETRKSFLRNKRILTIHNGIDTDVFKPVQTTLVDKYNIRGKFVILGMANKWMKNITEEKRRWIIENCGDNVIAILIGCSEKEIKNNEPGIIKVGYIREKKILAEYYSLADVFVNLTLEDSFPTVNLEALACGTPVITNKVTGATETIDNNTGYLITPGKLDELVEKISIVKTYGKRKYSDMCVERARNYFEKHNKYREYIELYFKLIRKESE